MTDKGTQAGPDWRVVTIGVRELFIPAALAERKDARGTRLAMWTVLAERGLLCRPVTQAEAGAFASLPLATDTVQAMMAAMLGRPSRVTFVPPRAGDEGRFVIQQATDAEVDCAPVELCLDLLQSKQLMIRVLTKQRRGAEPPRKK